MAVTQIGSARLEEANIARHAPLKACSVV